MTLLQQISQFIDSCRYRFGPDGAMYLLVIGAFLLFMAIEVMQALIRVLFRR